MAVDAKLLKQLSHKDLKERRKAIVALADCRDMAGVKPLENVAQNDADPKLRELASRAAKHLQEQVDKAAARAASPSPEPAYKGIEPEIRVSEKQMARAREYMDEAMSMVVAKDNGKAVKALAKALQTDPSLKADTYFLSLASTLFNTSNEEALKKLMSGSERGQYIKTQQQNKFQKRKDDHQSKAREIGWASAVFDLSIYAVVIAVITFLAPIVVAQLIERTVAYQQSLSPEKYAEETIKLPDEFEDMAAALQSQSPATLVIVAIVNGLGSAVSMLILCALIHVLATKLMGGHGTLPFMMSQLVPYYSMLAPVFFVWWCILMGMVSIGAGLFAVLCSPFLGLGSFTILFKSAGRIGQAYDFGTIKGCLSLLAASFALSLAGWLISTLILGAAINNAMMTMGFS